MLVNGDLISTLNYEELLDHHVAQKSMVIMCIREYEYNVPYGVVETENIKILALRGKPSYKFNVNAGVYVLDPKMIGYIPKDTFFDMQVYLKS